ncbi:hypothetical protein E3P91_03660 [Wallemia ichthyophaga]|nr:hypothetical protein E3P91_03660 [Wallemia ichthyophaga]TIB60645.1 hypothetical protein E3P78_03056 [Wallemia ichthyophaga]
MTSPTPQNPFIDDDGDNPFSETHALNKQFDDDDNLETPTQSHTFTYPTTSADHREEDLSRREADIHLRESRMKQFGRNNWPRFYPLIYWDIREEIPLEHRSTTLLAYRLWLFLIAVFAINWVGCLLLLIQGDGFESLAAASGYLFIIPISFLLWLRPLYNALMKGHAFYYLVYLFFGGCHLAFSVYVLIGIPNTGGFGIVNTIRALASGKIASGVLGVISSVGWAIQGLGFCWVYLQVYKQYKQKGLTIDAAKSEVTAHGFRAYFSRNSNI